MRSVAEVVEGLRALRDGALAAAGDDQTRRDAELQGLAGAVGLMAMALAVDEQQLETLRRLLTDLGEPPSSDDPARGLLTVCVVLARHALGSEQEVAQTIASVFGETNTEIQRAPEQRQAIQLAGAGRLLLLCSAWLDEGWSSRTGATRLERDLRGAPGWDAAASGFTAALDHFAVMVLGDWPPADGTEPLAHAFDTAAAIAVRVGEG